MGISPNKIKLIAQRWRRGTIKRPAVFLDRDGTVIRFKNELRVPVDIHLLRNAAKSLRALAESGFFLILVTNQPIVEKGVISVVQAKKLNEHLRRVLLREGVKLDAAYTCPHRFGSVCTCRKPDIGMLKQAQKDFKIDMKKSWLIGDTTRDMETGRRAKLNTILVKTGNGGKDKQFLKTKGKYTAKDLREACMVVQKIS